MAMNELDRLLTKLNVAIETYEGVENKSEIVVGMLSGLNLAKFMTENLKKELEQTK